MGVHTPAGELGCFGLTEKLAGVNSGLVVKTQAFWEPSKQMFRLVSASEGAHKNWISQGLVADKCAVVADLIVDGKSYGPHGFLMDFRKAGKVVPGVHLGDMVTGPTTARCLLTVIPGHQDHWE